MSVLKVTNENFNEIVENNNVVIMDFWAAWCGPCRMLSPILEEVANENPDLVIGKVNIDEEEELAEKFGITSIPTLIVFKNGKEHKKSVGLIPKTQVLALI